MNRNSDFLFPEDGVVSSDRETHLTLTAAGMPIEIGMPQAAAVPRRFRKKKISV